MYNEKLKQDLKDEFEFIFAQNKDYFNPMDEKKTFSIMNEQCYYVNFQEPTPEQKKIFIETICGRGYTEKDLIHLSVRIKRDYFEGFKYDGWALTTDAFFVGGIFELRSGDDEYDKVLYKDIEEVWTDFTIVHKKGYCISVELTTSKVWNVGLGAQGFPPLDRSTISKLGRFLNFAKNLT